MTENRKKTDKRLLNLKKDAGPGRPVGQRNYATIYREALIRLGELNGKTPEELETELIAKGFTMATKDFRFYKDVLDRIHGTPVNRTDLTSNGKELISDELLKERADKAIQEYLNDHKGNIK